MKGKKMRKMITLRKKCLALVLCLMMGAAALSGCGKGEKDSQESAEKESETEVPEVKGKEKTVGAFTLLVPKEMDAAEGKSESEVVLTDEDGNFILLQVVDKKEAKSYIKELQEENEKLKDESFTVNGISYTGAATKKEFYVYGKVGGKTVLASSEGFKLMDDIPLAVLASLEVDEDAEPVSCGGSSSEGTVLEACEGLYTYEKPEDFSETGQTDYLLSDKGSEIYLSYFYDADSLYDFMEDIEDYEEVTTADGSSGYLYEDGYGIYFLVPFDNFYESGFVRASGVYIFAYGLEKDPELSTVFTDLCKSVYIDPANCTDDPVENTAGDWENYWNRGWYGWYIVYDGDGKYKDDISLSYDCLAEFEVMTSGDVRFTLVQDDVDEFIMDVNLVHYNDNTDMGYLVSDSGTFHFPDTDGTGKLSSWVDFEIGEMDFMFDPEYDMNTLDDYLTFSILFVDDDADTVTVKGFLRPWGTDWDDIFDLNKDEVPEIINGHGPSSYEDMLPTNYDDWYKDRMYDPYPGIYAMSE
jgi:hypothetical protein